MCRINITTVILVLLSVASCRAFSGIGDRLWRTFLIFHALPLNTTDASEDDWISEGGCSSTLGIQYTSSGSPIVLYFTAGDQIAGVGLTIQDSPPDSLVPSYWKPQDSGGYEITLSFRNSSMMCSGYTSDDEVGDQLVINQDSTALNIPLNTDDATSQEWTPGHCINEMGTHWAYDTQTHPVLSHQVGNLVPVLPMYNDNTGLLSAFLIHINHIEKVEPFGNWEGPFASFLFCSGNFCPPCSWDVTFFSTLHFMLTDPSLNQCGTSCDNSIQF